MMKRLSRFIATYPLTCIVTAIIWVLCFIPIPETPLGQIAFVDKWTHVAMYLVLSLLIWGEYLFHLPPVVSRKFMIPALLLPIMMGGLIEILQKYCTNGMRSGEWLDFAADVTGVVVANIIGMLLAKYLATKKKDS